VTQTRRQSICPRVTISIGTSTPGLRDQCSADWTSPSSQAKVHHSGSPTDLQNKLASNQLSFFQLSHTTVFTSKTVDSSGHPSMCTVSGSEPQTSSGYRDSCRENTTSPGKLKEDRIRPVGAGSDTGLQVGANKPPRAAANPLIRDRQNLCRLDLRGGPSYTAKNDLLFRQLHLSPELQL